MSLKTPLSQFFCLKRKLCVLFLAVFLFGGCSTIGFDPPPDLSVDFGRAEKLRICALVDEPSVSQMDVENLLNQVNKDFQKFNIEVVVPWYRKWVRAGFAADEIIAALAVEELTEPCDRILAFVGRDFKDVLVGLIGVEVLGAVDTVTHTRGYVVAQVGSFNQILEPPNKVALHESLHLLGCHHSLSIRDCYILVSKMKRSARKNRDEGNDFFPGVTRLGKVVSSRSEVNDLERNALNLYMKSIRSR